ncbi:hypothetical protein SAMN05216302_106013 [Nitrosomonas aestuarii]|uniref:Uncharacterized protein n=1 Tax=Nitrosomonas aestuarii TaxID=52441 RepID=A0A1I4GRL1_9PROT|nr:hypothetical protein SAMN05216302_106013 [Nitrosomonas aestuarii]
MLRLSVNNTVASMIVTPLNSDSDNVGAYLDGGRRRNEFVNRHRHRHRHHDDGVCNYLYEYYRRGR